MVHADSMCDNASEQVEHGLTGERMGRTVLQTMRNRSLAATIESYISFLMFQELGPDAEEPLGVAEGTTRVGHVEYSKCRSINKQCIRPSYKHKITDFKPLYLGYFSHLSKSRILTVFYTHLMLLNDRGFS